MSKLLDTEGISSDSTKGKSDGIARLDFEEARREQKAREDERRKAADIAWEYNHSKTLLERILTGTIGVIK